MVSCKEHLLCLSQDSVQAFVFLGCWLDSTSMQIQLVLPQVRSEGRFSPQGPSSTAQLSRAVSIPNAASMNPNGVQDVSILSNPGPRGLDLLLGTSSKTSTLKGFLDWEHTQVHLVHEDVQLVSPAGNSRLLQQ